MTKIGLINIGIGLLLAAIGLTVSAVSYAAVSSSGGTYFVAYGVVAIGAWRFLLGIFQLVRGALSRQPASAQTTALQFAYPADALSMPVRVIAILFIVQAVTRVILLAILLLQARAAFFSYPQFLIMSIILPVVLAVGGVVAGVLALQGSRLARGFALTFCALGLLYQLYGVGNVIYWASTMSSYHLAWTAWILIPANILIYLAGLVIFARSPFYQVKPGAAVQL
jgi:hypothetical protein